MVPLRTYHVPNTLKHINLSEINENIKEFENKKRNRNQAKRQRKNKEALSMPHRNPFQEKKTIFEKILRGKEYILTTLIIRHKVISRPTKEAIKFGELCLQDFWDEWTI